ncbi:hypothetical protein PROFUN_02540 [Planoprotostelium fungivorum]|uniref:F-box domain-containing protein n=1 Tax=Planoprotostelium fungivorum TaxID=1890364 RepID=A0A2P6MP98_9EUKA|nr:hypothetical protein PROFUN_02540 [Planoprotostelium fungivorum]
MHLDQRQPLCSCPGVVITGLNTHVTVNDNRFLESANEANNLRSSHQSYRTTLQYQAPHFRDNGSLTRMADLYFFEFPPDKDAESNDVGGKRKSLQQIENDLFGEGPNIQPPPKRSMNDMEGNEIVMPRTGQNMNMSSNQMGHSQHMMQQQMFHPHQMSNQMNSSMQNGMHMGSMNNPMGNQMNHSMQNNMNNSMNMPNQMNPNMPQGNMMGNMGRTFNDPSMGYSGGMNQYNNSNMNPQRMMSMPQQQHHGQHQQNLMSQGGNSGMVNMMPQRGHPNMMRNQPGHHNASMGYMNGQNQNNSGGMNMSHNGMNMGGPSPQSPYSNFQPWANNNVSFHPNLSADAIQMGNMGDNGRFSDQMGMQDHSGGMHYSGNTLSRQTSLTGFPQGHTNHNSSASLSNDDLSLIFSFLPMRDVAKCAMVCQRWNSLAWKSVIHVDLSQSWNFFTNQSAARYMSDTLLRKFFSEKLDPNRVQTINAWGCEAFSNNVMETISMIPGYSKNLRGLNVRMTRVTSDGVRHICNMSGLESLTLMNAISDRDVQLLSKKLPRLQQLMIISSNITDASLADISQLRNLAELQLTGCERITDGGLEKLKGMSSIRTLWLSCTGVTDVGMQHLTTLGNLQTLVVTNCRITDLGLHHLRNLPNLNHLSLSYCYMVTTQGVESLPKTVHTNLFDVMGNRQHLQQQRTPIQ